MKITYILSTAVLVLFSTAAPIPKPDVSSVWARLPEAKAAFSLWARDTDLLARDPENFSHWAKSAEGKQAFSVWARDNASLWARKPEDSSLWARTELHARDPEDFSLWARDTYAVDALLARMATFGLQARDIETVSLLAKKSAADTPCYYEACLAPQLNIPCTCSAKSVEAYVASLITRDTDLLAKKGNDSVWARDTDLLAKKQDASLWARMCDDEPCFFELCDPAVLDDLCNCCRKRDTELLAKKDDASLWARASFIAA